MGLSACLSHAQDGVRLVGPYPLLQRRTAPRKYGGDLQLGKLHPGYSIRETPDRLVRRVDHLAVKGFKSAIYWIAALQMWQELEKRRGLF